jgi:hypothetical protein
MGGVQMKCERIGGCLKELTKDWVHPQECLCDTQEKLRKVLEDRETQRREKENREGRQKHLSDIEFVNQNARGK